MSAEACPIHALEGRCYTDPEIFSLEQKSLLAQTWQFAAHASQLESPGAYVAFEIAGEQLFCVRGQDGQIRTFYNVCQHRAHQLVCGSGSMKVIVCPYHAWTYELTGQLRAAPNLQAVEGVDASKICLTEVRTELLLDFVFVNLNPDAKPMEAWFPKVREELESWVPHFQRLKPLTSIEIVEKCNWKVSIENYSECYHCARNHPTFSNGVVKPETYDIQPQGYCLRHTTQCQELDKMTYDIHSGFEHFDEYSSWFLWPMFSFQVYPGNVLNTYHWCAQGPEQVKLYRGWYSLDGAEDAAVHKLAVQDRETTVEEDIQLVESVQRGLRSRGYVPGPLVVDPRGGVRSEHSIMHLQRWWREAMVR